MRTRLAIVLLSVTITTAAWAREVVTPTCNELPKLLQVIKANLALHTKTMTAEEVEEAFTIGPPPVARGFAYNFALLLKNIRSDIHNWVDKARTCDNVNQQVLAEYENECMARDSDFHTKWIKEKLPNAPNEPDRGRTQVLGQLLAARITASCFVDLSEKLLSPPPRVEIPPDLKTKSVKSSFPLTITIPTEFMDVTPVIYQGIDRAENFVVYCTPEDGQLLRDQLFGKRATEQAKIGCFFLQKDKSKYDKVAKSFEVESTIKELRKISQPLSTKPRLEMRVISFDKKEIRGRPTLAFVQDIKGNFDEALHHFFYVADGDDVWLARFICGKQSRHSAAIWDLFTKGL
jgi:hypothetical protein